MQRRLRLNQLSSWHQQLIDRLLSIEFPGRSEIKAQLEAAEFELIDGNQSVAIFPITARAAAVVKAVPVEAHAVDRDGIAIDVLLFTRRGMAYMIEILRGDGSAVLELPSADRFQIITLGR